MRPVDRARFLDWKASILSEDGAVGFAGFLLVVSSAVVLVGTCALVWPFWPEGRYLAWALLAPGLLAGMLWFQLAAPLFFRLHLALGRLLPPRRPRPVPVDRLVEKRPLHCGSCGRFAPARWPRCLFCRQPTGNPRGPMFFRVDERLNSLRAFGWGLSFTVFGGSLVALGTSPDLAHAGFTFVVLFGVIHLLATWHVGGWIAAFVAWLTLGVAIAWRAEGGFVVAAVVPAVVAMWMLVRWKAVGARLRGVEASELRSDPAFRPISDVPAWTPCIECGRRDAELLMPIVCFSFGFSVRWVLSARALCPEHAKRRARWASLFTVLFGWWGLPWGPIWSVDAINYNLDGGAPLGCQTLRDMQRAEEADGAARSSSSAFEFVLGFALGIFLLVAAFG